jgi:hypothetical protein
MAKDIEVKLKFTADKSEASKAIADLQEQARKLSLPGGMSPSPAGHRPGGSGTGTYGVSPPTTDRAYHDAINQANRSDNRHSPSGNPFDGPSGNDFRRRRNPEQGGRYPMRMPDLPKGGNQTFADILAMEARAKKESPAHTAMEKEKAERGKAEADLRDSARKTAGSFDSLMRGITKAGTAFAAVTGVLITVNRASDSMRSNFGGPAQKTQRALESVPILGEVPKQLRYLAQDGFAHSWVGRNIERFVPSLGVIAPFARRAIGEQGRAKPDREEQMRILEEKDITYRALEPWDRAEREANRQVRRARIGKGQPARGFVTRFDMTQVDNQFRDQFAAARNQITGAKHEELLQKKLFEDADRELRDFQTSKKEFGSDLANKNFQEANAKYRDYTSSSRGKDTYRELMLGEAQSDAAETLKRMTERERELLEKRSTAQEAYIQAQQETKKAEQEYARANRDMARTKFEEAKGGAKSWSTMTKTDQWLLMQDTKQLQSQGFESLSLEQRRNLMSNQLTQTYSGQKAFESVKDDPFLNAITQISQGGTIDQLQENWKKAEVDLQAQIVLDEKTIRDAFSGAMEENGLTAEKITILIKNVVSQQVSAALSGRRIQEALN